MHVDNCAGTGENGDDRIIQSCRNATGKDHINLETILSSLVIFLQSYQGRIPAAIGPAAQWILKCLLPFFLTCCRFLSIYKITLNKKVHFTAALQTAFFTSLLWELAKHLFAWYIVHLAEYSLVYGSLSTVVIFVLWIYYSSTILALGRRVCVLPAGRLTTVN